jgi:hypothetical protein
MASNPSLSVTPTTPLLPRRAVVPSISHSRGTTSRARAQMTSETQQSPPMPSPTSASARRPAGSISNLQSTGSGAQSSTEPETDSPSPTLTAPPLPSPLIEHVETTLQSAMALQQRSIDIGNEAGSSSESSLPSNTDAPLTAEQEVEILRGECGFCPIAIHCHDD